jgi:hypothetical protein
MTEHKFEEGDLVQYIETFYNNVHKIHRGVIIRKMQARPHPSPDHIVKYEVLTTNGETAILWADDLLLLENIDE